jgi:hypothetical protein
MLARAPKQPALTRLALFAWDLATALLLLPAALLFAALWWWAARRRLPVERRAS